ncbi:hypothetical protein CRENBAI_007013 [Crenichthys baileyi]|uniref:CTCK domain-containing protein n=1 Tax=Crenichthys baileyi TaxID=28760 RepID=A0AAV9RTQ1_9TELE
MGRNVYPRPRILLCLFGIFRWSSLPSGLLLAELAHFGAGDVSESLCPFRTLLKTRYQKCAVWGVLTQPGFSRGDSSRSVEVPVFTGEEKQFIYLVGQGTHMAGGLKPIESRHSSGQDLCKTFVMVNSTFVPPGDNCVQYKCEKINGQIVIKETRTTCPPFNPLDCKPGTETADVSGCCKICKPKSVCKVTSKLTIIKVKNCISAEPVNITSCVGHCRSSSMYSAAANMMTHHCECCHEATTSKKQVQLTCADGSKVRHSYTHVENCRCRQEGCAASKTKP